MIGPVTGYRQEAVATVGSWVVTLPPFVTTTVCVSSSRGARNMEVIRDVT